MSILTEGCIVYRGSSGDCCAGGYKGAYELHLPGGNRSSTKSSI